MRSSLDGDDSGLSGSGPWAPAVCQGAMVYSPLSSTCRLHVTKSGSQINQYLRSEDLWWIECPILLHLKLENLRENQKRVVPWIAKTHVFCFCMWCLGVLSSHDVQESSKLWVKTIYDIQALDIDYCWILAHQISLPCKGLRVVSCASIMKFPTGLTSQDVLSD